MISLNVYDDGDNDNVITLACKQFDDYGNAM